MINTLNKSFNNKPLISIVTVVLNGEKFLDQTIQSIINQTYKNIEYIPKMIITQSNIVRFL